MKIAKAAAYIAFSLSLAVACYLRPVPDDFDRYVYEALIRPPGQSIQDIYRIVKHESPRAEASTVMDSPEHLGELEPLYAIRPLYIRVASLVCSIGLSPQAAINFVSAASLFMCALVVGAVTQKYFYSALLIVTPGVLIAGRMGTPDALSSLAVVAGCASLLKDKLFAGILLLMVSIWIRTDNVLFVLAMLVWLVLNRKLSSSHATVLAALAVGSVEWINTLSGNYGWKLLFQYSFIGGKYPAQITPHVGFSAYVRIVLENAQSLAPQLAPWVLLGIGAWILEPPPERRVLIPLIVACVLRYLLFPSGEARYFIWAFLLVGIVFIQALPKSRDLQTVVASG
jgi:hypothetical protein